jgi:hypothetical protein
MLLWWLCFVVAMLWCTLLADWLCPAQNGQQLFNGVSAPAFFSDPRIRREVERHLERLVSQRVILEICITTYNSYPPRPASSAAGATGGDVYRDSRCVVCCCCPSSCSAVSSCDRLNSLPTPCLVFLPCCLMLAT